MQERTVDAVKVHTLRRRAAKLSCQNVPLTRLEGQTIEAVLKYLDLWEVENEEKGKEWIQSS